MVDVGVRHIFIPEISPTFVYEKTIIITPPYSGKVSGTNSHSGVMPQHVEIELDCRYRHN
jgi:hypothetical protein